MPLPIRALAVCALLAMTGTTFAATPAADDTAPATKPRTAQQQRMADCNKQATGKRGDERRTFMSHCLKGHATAPASEASGQANRMKTCNAEAGNRSLKGDERKNFMSHCLSSKTSAS